VIPAPALRRSVVCRGRPAPGRQDEDHIGTGAERSPDVMVSPGLVCLEWAERAMRGATPAVCCARQRPSRKEVPEHAATRSRLPALPEQRGWRRDTGARAASVGRQFRPGWLTGARGREAKITWQRVQKEAPTGCSVAGAEGDAFVCANNAPSHDRVPPRARGCMSTRGGASARQAPGSEGPQRVAREGAL
jgi:hypothetical protein